MYNPLKYVDPSGHVNCDVYHGDPTDCGVSDKWYDPKFGQNSRFQFYRLPVNGYEIDWIQWYGGTETAHQAHLNNDSLGYDAYAQGFYAGIDLGANWGTPVYAGVYGVVVSIGRGGSGDWIISIDNGDFRIRFQHLDGDFFVEVGDSVTPSTIIGGVGNPTVDPNDGNVHFHLEIRYSSTGVDDFKNRLDNPLLYMDEYLFADIKDIESLMRADHPNITFSYPEGNPQIDPLLQHHPIIRGGPILWND
jgi:murein DD-endopeptidase MepM/ murein hydrolase activator NlpD